MKLLEKRYAVKLSNSDDFFWNSMNTMWDEAKHFNIMLHSTVVRDFAVGKMSEHAARHTLDNKKSTDPVDVRVVEIEIYEK